MQEQKMNQTKYIIKPNKENKSKNCNDDLDMIIFVVDIDLEDFFNK